MGIFPECTRCTNYFEGRQQRKWIKWKIERIENNIIQKVGYNDTYVCVTEFTAEQSVPPVCC